MIKTKLQILVAAKEPLQNLSSKEMPLKTSYGLARLIRKINDELAVFEESRLTLVKKYGDLNEEEGTYIVPPDKIPLFGKEYAEFLDVDVELDCGKIVLPETINIKPIDLVALCDFIEIEGVTDD